MKIIEPSVELWIQGNSELEAKEHACKCAQISYQSEPKKGEAAEKFYNALINSGHLSCLRHESVYYKINQSDTEYSEELEYLISCADASPYLDLKYGDEDILYVATNGQYILEHRWLSVFDSYKVTPEEFKKECPELMRYTFCITSSIDITREFNRKSPNCITEESTRYCNYSKDKFDNEISIVRPSFVHTKVGKVTDADIVFSEAMNKAQDYYFKLLELGWKPEQARKVLPLATKSSVVYTYSIAEWEHIINLRYFSTTGKAHPDAVVIAGMVKDKLKELGYKFDK